MFSSSSSFSLQSSVSWLPPRPSPLLLSLPSELHAQPNVTLLLPQVKAGAVVSLHISTASLATAFQGSQCCFEKYQREQEKT